MNSRAIPLRAAACVLTFAGALAPTGCAANPPGAGRATTVDSACANPGTWRFELEALPTDAIASVQPKLFWYTCPMTAKVVGAKLLLRAGALGPEKRAQMLACRNAHVYLGDDEQRGRPAWLPGGWMDVDAEPSGEDLSVTLSAESVSKNIRLYRDTRALARR